MRLQKIVKISQKSLILNRKKNEITGPIRLLKKIMEISFTSPDQAAGEDLVKMPVI